MRDRARAPQGGRDVRAVAPGARAGEDGGRPAQARPGLAASNLVFLQRVTGNRAVAAVLRLRPAGRAGPTVQRDKGHSARFAGDPKIADVVAGVATLALGASGLAVVRLQQALVDLRYLPVVGGTGTFDATTRTALLKFQKDQGIVETGVFDTDSAKRLDAAFDTRKPYVDMAKHDPADPGTHALSAADRAAAVDAMVAAPVPGHRSSSRRTSARPRASTARGSRRS